MHRPSGVGDNIPGCQPNEHKHSYQNVDETDDAIGKGDKSVGRLICSHKPDGQKAGIQLLHLIKLRLSHEFW